MLSYTSFTTRFCRIFLVGDETGIQRLHLDTSESKREFTLLAEWQRNDEMFTEAKAEIDAYCQGKLDYFTIPLRPIGTEFQIKVWNVLRRIPNGEVRTYGQIAAELGNKNSCRAVGMANSKNPIPLIIPCHRVIGANGTLTGFASGLTIKQTLLDFEAHYYGK